MAGHNSSVFRFADVEVHESELHIRRNGDAVPVEPKAFRILLHLLRNPGRLIPKDELIAAGWGDTAVTDNSLTRNIALLRRLLRDDSREPRYIETVSTVGYRFVCPVEATHPAAGVTDEQIQAPNEIGGKAPAASRPRLPLAVAATAAGIACVALLAAWWFVPRPVPVVDSITQLTEDHQPKNSFSSNLVTDGSRIYFNEGVPGSAKVFEVSIAGGVSVPLQTSLADFNIMGAARDGSALFGASFNSTGPSGALWSISLPAGEPRRLGNLVVRGPQMAAVFPDNRILYSQGKDVLIAENDGSGSRKLASFPGMVWNTNVSPDGGRVLVWAGDLKIQPFAMRADGTGLREIRKANEKKCCYGWSSDGKYLLYSAATGSRWDLWALPFSTGVFERPGQPVRLTNGPLSFASGGISSRDGRQIFAIGSRERGQLVRYDMKSRRFEPLLGGISATDATYSKDGKWVAYTMFPEHTLWRSRSDGSERMQLTYPPMVVWEPFISPDGTKVVFDSMGDRQSVCVIDMNGGSPRTISTDAFSSRWSPDGNSLVYMRFTPDQKDSWLETAEVSTGRKSEIRSLNGAAGPFYLDPHTIAAANDDLTKLMIFDFRTRTWTDLVAANLQNWINSPDGRFVYYAVGGTEPTIRRIRVADRHVETVTSLKDFTRVLNFSAPQLRMAPDGSPTLTRAVDSQEIYALNVRWP